MGDHEQIHELKVSPEQLNSQGNPKKLTTTNINKLSSKFNKKKTVYLTIQDEEFAIEIVEHFRASDIQKIYAEYIKLLYDMSQLEGLDEEYLSHASRLFDAFVIKEFTNIPIPELDHPSKLCKVTLNLADLGITKALLGPNSPFSEDSLKLLAATLNEANSGMDKVIAEMTQMASKQKEATQSTQR